MIACVICLKGPGYPRGVVALAVSITCHRLSLSLSLSAEEKREKCTHRVERRLRHPCVVDRSDRPPGRKLRVVTVDAIKQAPPAVAVVVVVAPSSSPGGTVVPRPLWLPLSATAAAAVFVITLARASLHTRNGGAKDLTSSAAGACSSSEWSSRSRRDCVVSVRGRSGGAAVGRRRGCRCRRRCRRRCGCGCRSGRGRGGRGGSGFGVVDFDLVKEPVYERAIKVGPDQVGQFVRDLVCRAGGVVHSSANMQAVKRGSRRRTRTWSFAVSEHDEAVLAGRWITVDVSSSVACKTVPLHGVCLAYAMTESSSVLQPRSASLFWIAA